MITILSDIKSPRLSYVCKHIFHNVLGCDYCIEYSKESDLSDSIIYYTQENPQKGLWIQPQGLLSETGLKKQEIQSGLWNDLTTIFPTQGDIPFDLFSATFFLMTRYEEYGANHKDAHGRYTSQESTAHRFQFLYQPQIDLWAHKLKELILSAYPDITFNPPSYRFIPTIDVDNVYAFRYHGVLQTLYCGIRDWFRGDKWKAEYRFRSVLRQKKDPYFNLHRVQHLHEQYNCQPIFFFHCGTFGKHDKRTLYPSLDYVRTKRELNKKQIVGFHPSYHTSTHPLLFHIEKWAMPWTSQEKNRPSRFHYLRMTIPSSYRLLEKEGITSDWTMIYSDQPGFRASTSHPFFFYDLEEERESSLLIYPTTIMDKTLKGDLQLSTEEAFKLILQMQESVRAVNGCFITLFHNEHLTNEMDWKGWKNLYERILQNV